MEFQILMSRKSHTISVLTTLLLVLCYLTFLEDQEYSSEFNAKRYELLILLCLIENNFIFNPLMYILLQNGHNVSRYLSKKTIK